MTKNFILDTNILLQSPSSIYGFADNHVWIPGTVLQELDKFKSSSGEKGYNARECCRILDECRSKGDLRKGVPLPNKGKLFVEPDGVSNHLLPNGYDLSVPDNRILSTCLYLMKSQKTPEDLTGVGLVPSKIMKMYKGPVILVTNDISMRINASSCGIEVQSYKNDHIEDKDEYYGHTELPASPEMISELYANNFMDFTTNSLTEYEFVTLKCGSQSAMTMYKDQKLHLIRPGQTLFGGVKALNVLQSYAMYALTAPIEEIPLVILLGPAGTAKTYLSLAAGLSQTRLDPMESGGYRKILLSKPNVDTQEHDFGYLPGDLREKTNYLLSSFYDNIETLLAGSGPQKEDPAQVRMHIDDLMDNGVIEICPLHAIRGRSLIDSYMICDEAQNASRNLIRDIITRAGHGTKVVISGDPDQCDNINLDKRNNGLVTAAEMMKGHCAIIRFTETQCVRSKLAEAAIKYMKW